MKFKTFLFFGGLLLISLILLTSCSNQYVMLSGSGDSFIPFQNDFYTFELNPFVHYGIGTNTIINGQLNMLELSGSSMDFEYLSNTDYLNANYKRIETDFVISDSFINDYNSAVLTLDAQSFCGDERCSFSAYNSCWEQLYEGVWYLGIYTCHNYYCGSYDTIASDSGHAFVYGNTYRMVFERHGNNIKCIIYDSSLTEISSVSAEGASLYYNGYDGLMAYYGNITYDNTNITYTNGFVGSCINASILGGIVTGCND